MCFIKFGDKIKNRLGVMNKPMNVVHSGWMTKSPPEQKLTSPLKLFRAKWKNRFFVLHKPSGSLPDQYELSYYNSEQCSKKKGSIDLDQCEQIIESLDSEQYPFLLAIKTVCRGKVRTYYLATKTQDEMGTWVQCLCQVCGLKQEDTPTDIPPSSSPASVRASSVILSSPPPASSSPPSYLPLSQCLTGAPPKMRTKSTDSMPEYPAPSPPRKRGTQSGNHNNNFMDKKNSSQDNVFYDHPKGSQESGAKHRPSLSEQAYDHPKPDHVDLDVVDDKNYQVPPSRYSVSSDQTDLQAAVPLPRRSPHPARSSQISRPESINSTYDIPPPRRSSSSSQETAPSPPQRPPKPYGYSVQSPYQNLPSNSKAVEGSLSTVPAAPGSSAQAFSYDIPRGMIVSPPRESSALDFAPPAPCIQSSHSYLNTGLSSAQPYVHSNTDSEDTRNGEASAHLPIKTAGDQEVPPRVSDFYQVPPVEPRVPARSTPGRATVAGTGHVEAESDAAIWSTSRTKSFKRNTVLPNQLPVSRPPPLEPRPPPLPARSAEVASSSDDEDEDLSIDGNNTHHDLSIVRMSTVVAPPDHDLEPELKYLDLALDTPPEPPRTQSVSHAHGTPTEYREIDFVKTQALQDIKKTRNLKGKP